LVNPRQKGNRGEQQVISMLDRLTDESWTQTPGSGSGKIKGDLMVQDKHNLFTVEVKFYKECGFNSKIYTQKSNNLFKWWSKLCKQAQQMENDLRNFVNLSYGPNAWNEVLRIQADIRLKKKEAIKEAKRKQAQKIENFIIGVLLIFFLGVVGAVLYLILTVK